MVEGTQIEGKGLGNGLPMEELMDITFLGERVRLQEDQMVNH